MTGESEEEMSSDEFEGIAARIRHVLEIWPILSPTLLQAALGPQIKSEQWRPVLEEMISSGIIKQEIINKQSPAKRYNDYQRLMLAEHS